MADVSLVAGSGSVAITGTAAGGMVTMPAAPGSCTVTGAPTALQIVRILTAEPGAVTLASQAPTMRVSMPAASGTCGIAGVAMAPVVTMGTGFGAFVITGQNTALVGPAHFVLRADPASVVLTFPPPLMQVTMPAAAGTGLMITGADALLELLNVPPLPTVPVSMEAVDVPGRSLGRTIVELQAVNASERATRLVAGYVLPAGTRIVTVVYRCTDAFGTSRGLTRVDIGHPLLQDHWGRGIGIAFDTVTTYGSSTAGPLDMDEDGHVWVSAIGGPFDAVGACRLAITWEQVDVTDE